MKSSTYLSLMASAETSGGGQGGLQQGSVTANGLDFSYLETGSGPLALCLHGFPDSAWSWRHLLPELGRAGFHAVAPFLRGYHPTEVPSDARYQTGADMISDLRAAHANLEKQGADQTVTRLMSSVSSTQPTSALATLSDIFRRPRLSIGYAAAALLMVAVLAFGVWYLTRPKAHAPTLEAQRLYDTGTNAPELIAELAALFGVNKVLIGTSRRGAVYQLIKGSFQEKLEALLEPADIPVQVLRIQEPAPGTAEPAAA